MHRFFLFCVLVAITLTSLVPSGQAAPARGGRLEWTELAGSKGDENLQSVVSRSNRVIGLEFELTDGGDIGPVRPVSLKQRQPTEAPNRRIVTARPGYVLYGVHVDTQDKVHAIRLVFVRLNDDGSFARDDTAESDWVGTPTGKEPVTLGCDGRIVAGLGTSTKDGVLTGFSLALKANVAGPPAEGGAGNKGGAAAQIPDPKKFIAMMTEAAKIIESANDAASAQQAVEQIRTLARQSQNIGMGKTPPENAKAILERIDGKLQSLEKTLPEESRALQTALRELMESAATPAERNAATDRANRVSSASKLKQIVIALSRHEGDGNPSPASLDELVRSGLIKADVLNSPFGDADGGDIAYIRPAGNPQESVLLYDAAALALGEGTNVAYVDGSVQWRDEAQLRALNIPRPGAILAGGQTADPGGQPAKPQPAVELAAVPVKPANELLAPLLPYLVPTDGKKPTASDYSSAIINSVMALSIAGEVDSARWLLESVELNSDEHYLGGALSVQIKGGPQGADARAMFTKLKISLDELGTLEGVSLGYARAGDVAKAISNTNRFDGGKHLRKKMLHLWPSKELLAFYQADTKKGAPSDETDLETYTWAYAALGQDTELAKAIADYESLVGNERQGDSFDFRERAELNLIRVRGLAYRGDIAGALEVSDALFDAIQATKDKAKDPGAVNASAWSNRQKEYAVIIARLAADGDLDQVKTLIERHGNGTFSLEEHKLALAYLYAVKNDAAQADANLPEASGLARQKADVTMALGMMAHARAAAKDAEQAAAYIKRVEQIASTERTFAGRARIASAAIMGLLLGPEALAFDRLNLYAFKPRPQVQD